MMYTRENGETLLSDVGFEIVNLFAKSDDPVSVVNLNGKVTTYNRNDAYVEQLIEAYNETPYPQYIDVKNRLVTEEP